MSSLIPYFNFKIDLVKDNIHFWNMFIKSMNLNPYFISGVLIWCIWFLLMTWVKTEKAKTILWKLKGEFKKLGPFMSSICHIYNNKHVIMFTTIITFVSNSYWYCFSCTYMYDYWLYVNYGANTILAISNIYILLQDNELDFHRYWRHIELLARHVLAIW